MVSKIQQIEQLLGRISGRFPEKQIHPVMLKSRNRDKPILIEYLEGSEDELQREFGCRNIFVFCHLDEKGKRGCYIKILLHLKFLNITYLILPK